MLCFARTTSHYKILVDHVDTEAHLGLVTGRLQIGPHLLREADESILRHLPDMDITAIRTKKVNRILRGAIAPPLVASRT